MAASPRIRDLLRASDALNPGPSYNLSSWVPQVGRVALGGWKQVVLRLSGSAAACWQRSRAHSGAARSGSAGGCPRVHVRAPASSAPCSNAAPPAGPPQVVVMAAGTNDFQVGAEWLGPGMLAPAARRLQPRYMRCVLPRARTAVAPCPASWRARTPPPCPPPFCKRALEPHKAAPRLPAGLQPHGGAPRQPRPLRAAHAAAVGRRVCGLRWGGEWRC